MKKLILFLFVAMAVHAQTVNCSYGEMSPQGSTIDCTSTDFTLGSDIESATWLDQCVERSSGMVYMSRSSKVTGYGECWRSRGYTYYCHPQNETEVFTPGTSAAGVYNQFYNRMYDTAPANGGCPRNGGFHQDFQQCSSVFCQQTCVYCERGYTLCGYNPVCPPSPIIIDTGKGFHLTSSKDGPPNGFDFAGNGKRIRTGWTTADSEDAFLVCLDCWKDLPPVTEVKNGKYMFGNFTEQTCAAGVRNGYCALMEFDKSENGGNGDGVIDWHDAVWQKQLRGWIDVNHNGISEPSELHTLQELNVCSISLDYSDDTHKDEYGNWYHYKAVMHRCVGTPIETYDVFFAVDGTDTSKCLPKPKKSFTAIDY
jgi:hypothetical protein